MENIQFGKYKISKLIAGGNPISGFSHISSKTDEEMTNYFTVKKIKEFWDECLNNGINTIQVRADRHMIRAINEYRNDGKNIQWIAQIASELKDFEANTRQAISSGAIAVYLHGTYVDNLWHEGIGGVVQVRKDLENLTEICRENKVLAGIGTHRPEVLNFIDENFDADFYLASFYNLAKRKKRIQATEGFKEEIFDDCDAELMLQEINATEKTCLVFKILGAGKKTSSEKTLEEAFKYAIVNIKRDDAIIVGMWNKYKNQVKENTEIVRSIQAKQ